MSEARTMPGRRESLHRGMCAIMDAQPDWWDVPIRKAVGIAMAATGGAADPVLVAEEFRRMRLDRGLKANQPERAP